jgi:hypothetical protein
MTHNECGVYLSAAVAGLAKVKEVGWMLRSKPEIGGLPGPAHVMSVYGWD